MIPERVDGQGGAADRAKRGTRGAPARTAVGVAGRMVVILACATGLGLATSPGCGQGSPIDSAAGGGNKTQEEPIGQGSQAVVSAQACETLVRPGGASAIVFDAQIMNGAGATKNFGTTTTLGAGTVAGVVRQSLIQFDLSSIPPGPNTNIIVGTLNLAQSSTAPSGPETLNVYRATSLWNETTVTWNSFGEAYDAANSWGSFTNATSFPAVNIRSLVQGWVSGTFPNDGLVLDSPLNATSYWSSEYTSTFSRPNAYICFTVTCNPGFADCNNNGFDGCEVNTTTSVANCGGCGDVCNLANATQACVSSACAVGACNLGFGDCNHVAADGCETLLTTNANCGACGVACALPNAASSCATGSCTLTACNAGHYDCDGNPANGCEATPCVNGSHCANAAGCTSEVCVGGFCAAPACNDGVQNGTETAIDCGGGACPPCAVGLTCAVASDCVTGVCTGGVCQAAACNDGVKNGAETAVDCGGPTCPACASGQACMLGSDCTSGVCTASVCQAPTCNDGLKNGSETAVDCGGAACPACSPGKACLVGSDCTSLVCTGNVCQIGSCTDGVKNGNETGVDCGGGTCPLCNPASNCVTGADCASGLCVNSVCQVPTCTPGVTNSAQFGTTTCGVGTCQVTVQNCVNGVVQTCVPTAPLPADLCDGLDENCDGIVNGGCACTNGKTESCYTGAPATLGVGVCQAGMQTCAHGQWGACVGEVTPTAEICDGLDNDCNGLVDDGLGNTTCGIGECQATTPNCLNGLPQTCTPRPPSPEICDGLDNDCNGIVDDGLPNITCGVGACQNTVYSCVNGQPNVCVPGAPSPEVCDGIDNDCDGVVDNGNPGGNQACATGKLGVCSAGTTACSNGSIVCNQNVQPHAEICNGLDDDCDGVIDNGNPGGNMACNTGKLGVCAAGLTVCSSGQLSCAQSVQPSPEVCDGLDNDCNGLVDDGNPGGGLACSTGLLGVCAAGTTDCTAGQIACDENVPPSPQQCNGVDDNCNGVVDEGCACLNGTTQPCYSGAPATQNVGVCHGGTQTCAGGNWGACVGEMLPSPEVCDTLDNDCNGLVDDGLGTISCGVGECSRTVAACVNGQTNVCVPGAPSPEVCDGLDNDCDGVVDNGDPGGNQACNTGKQGQCAAGLTSCTSGAIVCVQQKAPSPEVCDGIDNDCDGVVDNGNPGGGLACGTGKQGVCGAGTTACTNGSIACNQNVQPSPEICDGLDNDCNGLVDDGNPGGGLACNTGLQGVCAAGTTSCMGGHVACNENVAPSPEVCDGLDNNCNGQVDEGLGSTTCGSAGCTVTVQNCVGGVAQACDPSQVNGQGCSDGNACTQTDTCVGGTCAGSNPVVCAPVDQCHGAGSCDPSTGVCSNPALADGTACNDGNACTQTDTCQAGVCTGGNPVVCGASDQCHVAGVCNTANGTCSNPAANDGTACNDGNACTQTDTCHSGTCTGSNPVVCGASDQCHVAGVCNPVSGTCSNPAANNGTACNDSNACTQTDTCQTGVCTGSNPVVCSASDQCHVAGVCNPASGTCSNPAANNGTACNDGNACTSSDVCTSGVCGGTAYTCSATICDVSSVCDGNGGCTVVDDITGTSCPDDGNPCTTDTCDGSGSCVHPAVANGTSCGAGLVCSGTVCSSDCFIGGQLYTAGRINPANACQVCAPGASTTAWSSVANGTVCNDGNACTQTDTCQAGTCTGSNPVVCGASDQCHVAGVCNPASGTCSNPAANNGTACNDGNACTQTDTCQTGVCTGGNPVVCSASDQCHVAGVCNTVSGTCSNPAANNGTACNDNNACTQTDTCQTGVCTGGNPVVCSASDQCHVVGVCNTVSGTCSNPSANNGTACNDNNACTQTDTCQTGVCTGSNPVVCAASDQCHVAGVCNAANGTCSNPSANNGTACNDGNACTKTDVCTSGICGGTAYVCSATSCDASSTCDGNGGCAVVDKVTGTSCPDDGNPCTSDTCDGAGNCTHPAVANGTSCGSGLVCNGTVCSSDCFIAGTLYATGTINPGNACQVCAPGTSTTAWSSVANGTVCSDGNACTQTDTCQSGTCTGSNPVVCGASDQCHVAGVCNPANGTCSNPSANNGTACNDNNACTQTDTCQTGVCTGSNPVVCTASDQCHVAGVCNTANGTCSNPAANNGTACNDNNACTQTDTCQTGVCTGSNPVVCAASDQCHVAGVCNTVSGTCSNPAANNGTACNDGNACTSSDQCSNGVCGGTAYTCTPTSCDVSSTCNGNGGCTVVDKASGAACPDDGNPCTSDTCDGSGNCAHPAVANGTGCGAGLVCNGTVCSSDCFIGGTLYAAGTLNPVNACQVCTPGASTTTWSTVAEGTSCGAGLVCNGTACSSGCFISGTFYTAGATEGAAGSGNNNCAVCTPATSTTAWSAVAAGTTGCAANEICTGAVGVCASDCYIGGTLYTAGATEGAAGSGNNNCAVCTPTTSTSAWSAVAAGTTGCAAGEICTGGVGACAADCYVGGVLYTSGQKGGASGNNACEVCTPAASTSAFQAVGVGTSCGAGTVCTGAVGACAADCYIGGTLYTSGQKGGASGNNACEVCTPATSTTAFQAVGVGTSCGAGTICTGNVGVCASDCYIGGVLYSSGQLGAGSGAGACEVCTPAASTSAFQAVGVGTSCGAGTICTGALANCAADCYVGGVLYGSGQLGAGSGAGACEVCTPATSTNAFQAVGVGTSCGAGTICTGALATCAADCYVGGALYTSGQKGAGSGNGACEVCTPATSTSAFQAVGVGTSCGGGTICTGALATCSSDCYIGGVLYSSGQYEGTSGNNSCQECVPGSSTSAWTGTNGTPNGGSAACSTGLQGVCAAGTTTCSSGALTCAETTAPSVDKCDNLDNDCNGTVDNALDEGFANSCGAAQVIDVSPGQAVNMVGTTLSGTSDYLVFHFINDPGPGNFFQPLINLVSADGSNAYLMTIQSAGCGGAEGCLSGSNPGTTWEMSWPTNPNNCQAYGECTDNTPHVTTVVAVVSRASGSALGKTYTITASNCNGACGTTANATNNGEGDGNSNTCAGAATYEVQPGGAVDIKGHLPDSGGSSDFFQVAFQSVPSSTSGSYYHPIVNLTGYGNNEYLLNVDSPACSAYLSGTDQNCNNVKTWEMSYPSNPNSCQSYVECIDNTAKIGNPWVQVVRVASGNTCSNYNVHLSNQ